MSHAFPTRNTSHVISHHSQHTLPRGGPTRVPRLGELISHMQQTLLLYLQVTKPNRGTRVYLLCSTAYMYNMTYILKQLTLIFKQAFRKALQNTKLDNSY